MAGALQRHRRLVRYSDIAVPVDNFPVNKFSNKKIFQSNVFTNKTVGKNVEEIFFPEKNQPRVPEFPTQRGLDCGAEQKYGINEKSRLSPWFGQKAMHRAVRWLLIADKQTAKGSDKGALWCTPSTHAPKHLFF